MLCVSNSSCRWRSVDATFQLLGTNAVQLYTQVVQVTLLSLGYTLRESCPVIWYFPSSNF